MSDQLTIQEFIRLWRLSQLHDPQEIDKIVADLEAAGKLVNDSHRLAKRLVRHGVLTYFQATSLLQGRYDSLLLLNKYRVLDILGRGGMGKVYLAEHRWLGTHVALKFLPSGRRTDHEFKKRFQREARTVARLNHPNIVRAIDFEEIRGTYCMVMEYVDGVTLHDLVERRGRLDPIRAAHYVSQAAEGLEAIRQAGIVHRDIKPGNLMLDRSGTIKILDLGLTRFVENPNQGLVFDGEQSVLGTPSFVAPEQAVDSEGVDIRADIYSLGAVFFHIVAGRPPFLGESSMEIVVQSCTEEPDSLADYCPAIPARLSEVARRMLSKDPTQRYQTPSEVIEALAEFTSDPLPPPDERDFISHRSHESAPVTPTVRKRAHTTPVTRQSDKRRMRPSNQLAAFWFAAGGLCAASLLLTAAMLWRPGRPATSVTTSPPASLRTISSDQATTEEIRSPEIDAASSSETKVSLYLPGSGR